MIKEVENKKVAIVVPIYKTELSETDRLVLENCFQTLGSYQCFYVCGKDFNADQYEDLARKFNICFDVLRFDNDYFSGIEGYNRLMLSKTFYSRFKQFEYMLINQLDTWVFRDELISWCEKGYHLIGAPLVKDETLDLFGANGGFSLRHIGKHIELLTRKIPHKKWKALWDYHRKFHGVFGTFLRLPKILLERFGYKNNSVHYAQNFTGNEDKYWNLYAPQCDASFRLAPAEEGLRFAFERYPSHLFKINNEKLPFGCHAWEKHEIEFWQQFISIPKV